MSGKRRRQQEILDLISSRPISTQQDLAEALRGAGTDTAQSTLSKDLRELGVIKAPDGDGTVRYRRAFETPGRSDGPGLLRRELSDFVLGVDGVDSMLVLKTIDGHAQGVCEAVDREAWPEVVGTIAGENTIFVLCRSRVAQQRLRQRIEVTAGGI